MCISARNIQDLSLKFCLLGIATALISWITPFVHADAILNNNFSNESVWAYSSSTFKNDTEWKNVKWADVYDRASIISNNGDKKLRFKFPKWVFWHKLTGWNAGVHIWSLNEVYQSFDVLFEAGFSFKKSWKIAGLASDVKYSGGNIPKNWEWYSSRFIWHNGSKAWIYLYHMDQKLNLTGMDSWEWLNRKTCTQ